MPGDSLTYREAYARLSRIATELETGEADLDRVLPLLEEARAAYAACRERIAAVQTALAGDWGEEATPEDEGEAAPAPDDDPF